MADIIVWIKTNWDSVLAIIGGTVSVASIIVKLTPTPKDDTILAKIKDGLSVLSIFNSDGSSIGKKKEE